MSKQKQVVLITGASSGMGKATAKLLLQEGYTVYATARRVDRMNDLKQLGAKVISLDVTDELSMVSGVNQIIAEQGRIDVLFNNAGYGSYGAVEDVPLDEVRRQFEVNLFGIGRLTQLVLPHMRKQKFGTIINNSSMGGKIYTPLGAWYHATKHALEGYSDCLRLEVAPFGVRVVIIEPGSIATEWGGIMLENLKQTSSKSVYVGYANAFIQFMMKMKGASSPDVIARVVLKAIRAKRPKTRYVAGAMAKQFMMMRKLMSDRMFDRILNRMLGVK